MELPTYFADFLADVRPTEEQLEVGRAGHQDLREKLKLDEDLSPIIVNTFLQGSYRRSTAVQSVEGKKLDVDVVVVTRLKEAEFSPEEAINAFLPFVKKHYGEDYEVQGRSIGLYLDEVDLDLVITSAPSEEQEGLLKSLGVTASQALAEAGDWSLMKSLIEMKSGESLLNHSLSRSELLEKAQQVKPLWKIDPLRIPDRDAQQWRDTHPIAQMEWTWEKNARCDGHYVNVVKALKWWRSAMKPTPKYPKGYPIEHLIGSCCPDDVTSVAQGITLTLETIATRYAGHAAIHCTPSLEDHGVKHDVLARITGADFAAFHGHITEAANLARQALDTQDVTASARLWRELFGAKFPQPPSISGGGGSDGSTKSGGFTERTGISSISGGRFGQSAGNRFA